jgi:hypothetical protein
MQTFRLSDDNSPIQLAWEPEEMWRYLSRRAGLRASHLCVIDLRQAGPTLAADEPGAYLGYDAATDEAWISKTAARYLPRRILLAMTAYLTFVRLATYYASAMRRLQQGARVPARVVPEVQRNWALLAAFVRDAEDESFTRLREYALNMAASLDRECFGPQAGWNPAPPTGYSFPRR